MKKKKLLFILLITLNLICVSDLIGQVAFTGGVLYGGPIPIESVENTQGHPLFTPSFGSNISIEMSPLFSIEIGAQYVRKGADYKTQIKNDTIIPVEINNITYNVPSYYTADIKGKMRLNYLQTSSSFKYKPQPDIELGFGPFVGFLLSGSDQAKIDVTIGEGGFIDNYIDNINNYADVHKIDFGLLAFYKKRIFKTFSIKLTGMRSLKKTHKKTPQKVYTKQKTTSLFHTHFQASISYFLK